MIIFILSVMAAIGTGLYVYFEQVPTTGINLWSLPVIFPLMFVAAFVIFYLILGIISLFLDPKKIQLDPPRFFSMMIEWTTRFLITFSRMKIVFENEDLIPKNHKFFLISNHQSNWDPITLIGRVHGHTLTYIMKDSLLNVPIVGTWLRHSGFLPLDRKNDRKALEVVLMAIKKVKGGQSLGVCPEGTRSKGPQLGEFRPGVFKIPLKAEAPIVIVALDGFYKIKFHWPFRTTQVYLKVCEVLPYESFASMSSVQISEKTHAIIQADLEAARIKYPWLN
ncbi:MAG TPA: hypothetical protein DD618_03445 [Acholeplasmatales bacterium]|nr:hypothetical protein [Acholeplasmatales bacterium]